MRQFLTSQSMSKKRNVILEKEDNKVYSQNWKHDLEKGLIQEKETTEKVNLLLIFKGKTS
jgi:hypothetical protein